MNKQELIAWLGLTIDNAVMRGEGKSVQHLANVAMLELLTAPPAPVDLAALVPDGWKLVPIEPSKEMRAQIHPIAVGNCRHCGNRTTLDCEENMLLSWRDMLEVAPKPEDKC